MGTGHCPPPPDPVAEPVAEPVVEPEVPEVEEDVPVARGSALIEESLNATLASTPSVTPKE